MLNTYKHTMRTTPVSEVTVDPPEEGRERLNSRDSISSMRRLERKVSTASIHRDDFAMPDKLEALAEKIMTELEAIDKLNFEQFVKYVEANPRIMDVFTAVFREEIWANKAAESPAEQSAEPKRKKGCCCDRRSFSVKVHTKATSSFLQERSGWLHRKGRRDADSLNKQFAFLKSNMLLLYSSPLTPMPVQVIFMEGCYIDKVVDHGSAIRYGFIISHHYDGLKEYNFWCGEKGERDEWVHRLETAAKVRRIDEYYEFKERLGTGKFSDVYAAIELQTDFRWAIKIVDKKRLNEAEREMLRSEIAIMKLLNHPNVVEMKEVFEDKNKMYVVMELIEGGELFDRIRRKKVFSEFMAYNITRQLLEIVKYLHDVGIVHRDIKPENILLSDDSEIPTIKLADFGLSQLVGPNDCLFVPCGTLGYVAPEVLQQLPYGKQVDMWSLGAVIYLMLRGKLPFDSKDKLALMAQTIECAVDVTGPYWSKYTEYSRDFVLKLLAKDPADRLTSHQALLHPWIKNGDIVIPRKINKRAVEEDLLRKTITSSKMHPNLYDENPKSSSLDPSFRLIYTTPDIFEDMQVERKSAEPRLVPPN